MGLRILHAATRAAVQAATSQQGQCEALRDAFAGNVTVRIYGAGSQHLRTVTLPPFGINSSNPRGLTCGAFLADTAVAPTTPGSAAITPVLWEFRDGSTVIFDTDAITHGGIKALCTPRFGSVVFTAQASLPVGAPLAAFDTGINGAWTWFTTPVSRYYNGATYFVPVDSSGNSEIHRYDHAAQTTASFTLSASPDVDDHNNGSVEILDDGKIIAYWTTHYDSAVRFKVSSSADSIAAFGTLQSLTPPSGNVTYPVITRLSSAGGKRWLFYRNNNGTTQDLSYRTSSDFSAGSGSASAHVALCTTLDGATAYWRIACNDSNRIDVILVDRHPVQGNNELYHFYGAPDGSGDLKVYKTNGTEITASLPFDIAAQATQAVTGEVLRKWIWDVVRRPDGEVWVLWTRFIDLDATDHRLMFVRCNSSGVWQTPVAIVAQGGPIDTTSGGERYYSPGACFDAADPTTIYLSAPVTGVNQVQRWATTDGGASWSQQQVYTSGGTAGSPQRFRPFSPKNHNGEVPVLWCSGTYTSYLSWDTNIWGAR